MMIGVLRQRPRDLLRRRDTQVYKEIPMNAMRIVDIQKRLGKIGTVVKQQIKVPVVRAVVELVHEPFIFLGCCLNLEAVDPSVIRLADQLRPLATRTLTRLLSRNNLRPPCPPMPT